MLICLEENCTCLQHRILDCLEGGMNEEAKSILKKLGNHCEWKDTSGLTLLLYSIKYGNAEMTQHLIEEGCNVNAQNDFGITPLMLAVNVNDVKIVEILLKNNADIYLTDGEGKSSLEMASLARLKTPILPLKQTSHFIMEMVFDRFNNDFLKGASTQFLSNANNSVKFDIVVFGNAEAASFVLENGYPIDFRQSELPTYTAIRCAIALARYDNAKILIEQGANVDEVDKFGHSPLFYYTTYFEDIDEDSEVLKSLLSLSNNLSTPENPRGLTCIEKLAMFGNEKTVRTLLLSDIDVDASQVSQNRPLQYFLTINRKIDNLDFLAEFDVKFDVNQRLFGEHTILMIAAYCGCPKKIAFLLRRGADVNFTSSNGDSAFSSVFEGCYKLDAEEENNRAKVIELLLQSSVDDDDVQSIFGVYSNLIDKFLIFAKVVAAHLAMLGAVERSSLTDSSRDIIESKSSIKSQFDLCTRQLEEMKRIEVHGTVTLFKLLTERKEKIIAYTRNREFLEAFNTAMKNWSNFESYYVNTLQKRVSRALEEVKLQEKVASIIEALTGLCIDTYHFIVYKIIECLDRQDLRNMCRTESIL